MSGGDVRKHEPKRSSVKCMKCKSKTVGLMVMASAHFVNDSCRWKGYALIGT